MKLLDERCFTGLLGCPGESVGQEDHAVAEGLAGEGDSGVGGDGFALGLQLSGGAEDPPGGGFSDFGDGEEDADGALPADLGDGLEGGVVEGGGGGGGLGLDGDGGTGFDAGELEVGHGGGGEEGGAHLA